MAKRRTYSDEDKFVSESPVTRPSESVSEKYNHVIPETVKEPEQSENIFSESDISAMPEILKSVSDGQKEFSGDKVFDIHSLENNVGNCLSILDDTVMHSYVTRLSDFPVIEPLFDEDRMKKEPYQFFHINKLVYEKDEFSVSKFSAVFQSLSGKNCTLVLLIQNRNNMTDFYLGVRDHQEKDFTGTLRQMLEMSLKGQFPGSDIETFSVDRMQKKVEEMKNTVNSVSCVSCVPDFKQDKGFLENKDFLQGLEKFVISMQNKEYTAVFVADAVRYEELTAYRTELESVYTQLSPFANMQYQVNTSNSKGNSSTQQSGQTNTSSNGESSSFGTNYSSGHTRGTNISDTQGEGYTHTTNQSQTDTDSHGRTVTDGTNESTSEGKTTTNSFNIGGSLSGSTSNSYSSGTSYTTGKSRSGGGIIGGIGTAIGTAIGGPIGGAIGGGIGAALGGIVGNRNSSTGNSETFGTSSNVGGGINGGYTRSVAKSHTETTGTSHSVGLSDTISQALTKGFSDAESANKSHTVGRNDSDTVTEGNSEQHGTHSSYSESFNFGHSETITDTFGSSQGIMMQSQNMMINNMLERLKKQIKRIDECESIGMWNCAAYFMSENRAVSETAANTYRSLVSGKSSGVERSAVNTWTDRKILSVLTSYITHFCHPQFLYNYSVVSPAVLISTKELAIQMSFPRKSVCGLPVTEHAVFGQQIVRNDMIDSNHDYTINLGKVYHLSSKTEVPVRLDVNSLTMHTFVTGSTGAGKSNTIYHILDELRYKKIPFLVIEPAKGEYRTKFNNAQVFCTNPNVGILLKLNPFSFPEEVHIQEHIDRLTELFNVCWSMYAAMPAVLKDAIICAYESAGWDMNNSSNSTSRRLYPTFSDVLRELENVVNQSDYSGDTSSDYKGALKTRLKSLTNGINGMIFSGQEIPPEKLFDTDTIVDLSRVGSMETKSLIMGILVMKLQEYRMSKQQETDSDLRHITVLEEAHHLLKKTSTEQGQETANLQGKSVEMLTNAIAEMRTYGEGFIIADQAPDLLDTAVIRNTNTKIVMRLPEGNDRKITGMSIALDDNQVKELSKLPQGVAAVYQNNWQEAVLCAVPKYVSIDLPADACEKYDITSEREILAALLRTPEMNDELKNFILSSDAPASVRKQLLQSFDRKNIVFEWAITDYITDRFRWECMLEGTSRSRSTIEELGDLMLSNISNEFPEFSTEEQGKICYYICRKANEVFPEDTIIENVRVYYFQSRFIE